MLNSIEYKILINSIYKKKLFIIIKLLKYVNCTKYNNNIKKTLILYIYNII